jgi:hypothetical protein
VAQTIEACGGDLMTPIVANATLERKLADVYAKASKGFLRGRCRRRKTVRAVGKPLSAGRQVENRFTQKRQHSCRKTESDGLAQEMHYACRKYITPAEKRDSSIGESERMVKAHQGRVASLSRRGVLLGASRNCLDLRSCD